MILKIDMHVHTSYSDSSGSVDEVLEEAQRKGLDGVAITDHKTIRGVHEALKKRGNLIIIPGQEVRTKQCEILALGIKKKIEDDLPVLETIKRIHAQQGLAVLPHPTVPFFGSVDEKIMKSLPLDGIEVFSSITPLPWYFFRKNLKLARKLGIPILAGSDSHAAETVGDAYTIIRCEDRRVQGIIRAIKLGQTSIGGGPSKLSFKLRMIGNTIPHIFFKS
ncbi:PHP domain-containing protein [Candidatus Bathyarchaeota archaeon]|nr:PHP domain-containing protein [Candidatus Bathyarchaeota archaeon]